MFAPALKARSPAPRTTTARRARSPPSSSNTWAILSQLPKLNALSFGSWLRIAQVFDELGGDRALRAVVVRGAGERAFSAGANIEEFPALRMSAEAALDYNAAISNALEAVMGFE